MRPKFDKTTNTLTVEFHKPDIVALTKARDIGQALVAMNQAKGQELVDIIDSILFGPKGEPDGD